MKKPDKKKGATTKPSADPEREASDRINRQSVCWERYYVTHSLDDLASYIEAGGDIDPQVADDGTVFNDVRKTIVSVLRGEHMPPSKGRKDWDTLEFYLDVIEARENPATNTLVKVYENTELGKDLSWDGFDKRYKRGLKIARTIGADENRTPPKSGR
jgi:hypothetical protein